MKNVFIDTITSRVFDGNVIDWILPVKPLKHESIETIDKNISLQYTPKVVTAFIPSNQIEQINCLNNLGYDFIQCRLNVEREISPDSYNLYPFQFEKVTTKEQLSQLIKLCDEISFDDRYSIDNKIGKKQSKQRIKLFLENSYKNKNEFLYLLVNKTRNTVHGFRSFREDKKYCAKMLLTGVVENNKLFDYGKIINNLELFELYKLKFRKINSVISINNHDEINRYISEYKYKVKSSTSVLRKLY